MKIFLREMTSIASKTTQQALTEQNSVCERLGLLLDIIVAQKDLCDRLDKGLHHDHALALSKLLSMKKRKIQGVIRGSDVSKLGDFNISFHFFYLSRLKVLNILNPKC